VARVVEDPGPLIEGSADEIAELSRRAAGHSPESLQQLFRVLLTRTQELATAPRPAQALEVALVRLATLPDTESIAALLGRVDALLGAGGAAAEERRPAPAAPARGTARAPAPAPPVEHARAAEPEPEPAPEPQPEAPAQSAAPSMLDPEEFRRLRSEAKAHPAVQEVIETLDAEIREIRMPRR
jgi:DNA polymerase III gamma/tau subunit